VISKPAGADSGALVSVLLVDPSPMSRTLFGAAMADHPEIHVQGVDRVDAPGPNSLPGPPDFIVLQLLGKDLSQQQLSSNFELCRKRYPTARILVLARDEPPDSWLAALAENVSGYLTTDHGVDALVSAMHLVRAGLLILPHVSFHQMIRHTARTAPSPPAESAPCAGKLTSRQSQVFELILGGLSNREIADRLTISESTVKVHVRSIMQRASVSSRTQLLSRFLGNRA
jgi:DNA-binding NarL/FixJ family response regulator